MIGTGPIQAAIYQALVDAAVVATGRVVDGTSSNPDKIGFPYVEIGDTQSINDDVIGRDGTEEFLSLHIWSRQRGQTEVKTIAAGIMAAFNNVLLSVSGYSTVLVGVDGVRFLEDPDGLTRHGVLTLHIHAFGE